MRAFKWDDGLQEWERELGSEIVSDPVLFANDSGGRIMLALEDRRLVGLDAWNGEVMWELGQEVISGSVVGGVTLGEDGVAYGATDEGRAYAIDPLSGEITGQADLSAYGSFNQPPAVGQNAIYVTDWNQSVYAVNPYDGDVFWQSDIRGNATTPVTLAAGQNRLFVGTDEGFVHALWIDSGGQAWAPQRVSGQVVGLAQDGTRLYATVADGTVYAWFIETGETAWAINTGTTQLNTHPLTDGQHVLVITPRREGDEESGDLRYLRAEDGLEETDWRIKLYDGGYRAPAPAGGWLFVPAWQVYGFGPP
jgi:outer membrane protein assembly factor BamB